MQKKYRQSTKKTTNPLKKIGGFYILQLTTNN